MDNDFIIAEAVKRAQEHARQNGLSIGQTVAHPSDRFTYGLISVSGDVATVGLPASKSKDGKEVEKQFPLNELFDPNTVRDLIGQVVEDGLNKNAPPGYGVMVVKL